MIFEILLVLFSLSMVAFAGILSKKYGYEYLISMYVGCIVLAAVLGSKMFTFFGISVDGTIVVFSVTLLIADILREFFGKKEAKKAVWGGFVALLMAIICIQITIHLSPASFWHNQEAFVLILGNSWRIMLASISAYIVTEYFNIWCYGEIKDKTQGKHLWLRSNFSAILSQLLNTLIFTTIAFAGLAPLLPLIIGSFIVKTIVALMETPFLYLVKLYWNRT